MQYSSHIILKCSLQPTLIAVSLPTNTSSPLPLQRPTEHTPAPSLLRLDQDSAILLHLLVSSSNKHGNRDPTRLSQRKCRQHLVFSRCIFFRLFPLGMMNNIDFISEKWRTCRRTRDLTRIHLAQYILPIIYLAVYAEVQRQDGTSGAYAPCVPAIANER